MIEEIGGARLKKSDFIGINECFKPIEREYKRGEIITTYSPENDTICIIKEGTVYLTTDNRHLHCTRIRQQNFLSECQNKLQN